MYTTTQTTLYVYLNHLNILMIILIYRATMVPLRIVTVDPSSLKHRNPDHQPRNGAAKRQINPQFSTQKCTLKMSQPKRAGKIVGKIIWENSLQ